VFDPCVDSAQPLVGVTVVLYNYRAVPVAETVTDEFGYYEFTGLPLGRYFVMVEYEECSSSSPSLQPTNTHYSTFGVTEFASTVLSSFTSNRQTLSANPSVSAQPTAFPTGSPSISMSPSFKSSLRPSVSTSPSEQPSVSPTKNNSPSSTESLLPSTSLRPFQNPSDIPTKSYFSTRLPLVAPTKETSSAPIEHPTFSPVDGMIIRRPAFDPCNDNEPLVGATVTLYDAFGEFVAITVTDSEGYYTFAGLPLGRYRTDIDYPACDRRELSINEHLSPLSLPGDNAVKFYSRGDSCDVSFGGLSLTSIDDLIYFDTLDECCANIFWYDMDGCFSRSRVAFQFEFCLDVSGLDDYSSCPIQVIESMEGAMKQGLGENSEVSLVKFGSTTLTNAGGKTKCIDPLFYQDTASNQLRGFIGSSGDNLNICGEVVTKAECTEELCLREAFDDVVVPFQSYFYNKAFSSALYLASRDSLHPLHVVVSSFIARKLLLPSTVSSSKPRKNEAISTKTSAAHSTFTETPRFYPTYVAGELCLSKTSFDSWEESHGTLKECCEAFFSWDFEECCSSLNMGGC